MRRLRLFLRRLLARLRNEDAPARDRWGNEVDDSRGDSR